MSIRTTLKACLLLSAACLPLVRAQARIDVQRSVAVDQNRGADPTLDYASLLALGPWDDRNYSLTAADLRWLGVNEREIRGPLPAFFRVALRRARPGLSRDSRARYPHTALNTFMKLYGGYMVDGEFYRRVQMIDGHYLIELSSAAKQSADGTRDPDSTGLRSGAPGANPSTEALGGEVRVSAPEGESEGTVAVSPANTNLVIAGTVRPNTKQEMYYSTDGGQTWLPSELPLASTCCDPAVAWSADGAKSYATSIGNCSVGGCDLYFYRSADGGASWSDLESDTPAQPRRTLSLDGDRETIHVDTSPVSPFKDRIYVAYHELNVMQLARSSDFGSGWSGTTLSSAAEDLGVAGDVTTDRAGSVYYAWPAYDSRTVRVASSTDGGATFGASSVISAMQAAYEYALPAQDTRLVTVYTSVDCDRSDGGPYSGSVYVAWSDTTAPVSTVPADNHSRVRVAATHDGGASWTVVSPHPTSDQMTVDRFHPYLRVGPDGTLHVVYYDTGMTADRTGVDLYYSYSTDGGLSFSTPRRVTSETSPAILDWFELGDYLGLDMAMNSLIAAFADNRSETGVPGDSVDVYAAGIDPGPGSGAGRIPGAEGVGGNPMSVRKNTNGSDLDLSWDVACGNGSDYEVYEGLLGDPRSKVPLLCSTGGQTSATVTPGGGARFYLVVAADGGSEGSYGRESGGGERLPDPGACLAQAIGACP